MYNVNDIRRRGKWVKTEHRGQKIICFKSRTCMLKQSTRPPGLLNPATFLYIYTTQIRWDLNGYVQWYVHYAHNYEVSKQYSGDFRLCDHLTLYFIIIKHVFHDRHLLQHAVNSHVAVACRQPSRQTWLVRFFFKTPKYYLYRLARPLH